MVRLKVGERIQSDRASPFQFQMVRLKDKEKAAYPGLCPFQFQMIRLKVRDRSNVESFYRRFNSKWYD